MPFHTTNNIAVRFSASFENRFVVCFYYNIECFSCLAAGNKNHYIFVCQENYFLFVKNVCYRYYMMVKNNLRKLLNKKMSISSGRASLGSQVVGMTEMCLHTQTQKGVKTIVEK